MTRNGTLTTDGDLFWDAIIRRDARFDPVFVFGVRSTGIFCRPSCPARRPRREVVEFLSTSAEAQRAGFRACRRCHSDQPLTTAPGVALVQRACRALDRTVDRPATLSAVGAAVGATPHRLQRLFRQHLGITPKQYVQARRVARFKSLVRTGATVTDAMYDAGFGSSSRLYERAASALGMTPAQYRRRGAGLAIRFSVAPCALGRVLVAATTRGICAVMLGDRAHTLEQELRNDLPAAAIACDDHALGRQVRAVLRAIDGAPADPRLDLDLQGTAFQLRVWRALQAIPRGQQRTYADLARAIGQPAAARAVGRACATNPVSVLVPCHRAVGSDGALHGYRWGLKRKAALLRNEQRMD